MNVKGFSILAVAMMMTCSFIGFSLTTDDSDAATWNAVVGTWFEQYYYEPGPDTEFMEVDLRSSVPGLTYEYADAGGYTPSAYVRVYGTPTSPGTFELYLEMHSHGEDEDYTETIYVYVADSTYTHTVAYDNNGATGGSVGNTVVTDSNSGNAYVTLAANGFSRPGYMFVGWSVNGVTYQPGQSLPVGANSSVTAVAQWSLNTVTASANGLSGLSGLSYSIQVNAQANNGATFTYAVKSLSAGTASVSSTGMVTFNAPSVSSTTNCNVVVTVTAHYPDGQTKTADAAFTVTVDPVLVFTNSVTNGTLSIKGA